MTLVNFMKEKAKHPQEDLFLSSNLSKLLMEKSFDGPCFAYYEWDFGVNGSDPIQGEHSVFTLFAESEFFKRVPLGQNSRLTSFTVGEAKIPQYITTPLYQQAIDWFWEKHRIRITQQHQDITGMWFSLVWKWNGEKWSKLNTVSSHQYINEALNGSIDIALKEI